MKKNGKKKIFLIFLLSIVIFTLINVLISFLVEQKYEKNDKKIISVIENINHEKIDYVFVEINPSFILKVKDAKVLEVGCLNDDCLNIYNDIKAVGKDINDTINDIYNLTKDKGFDISKGVNIKTNSNIEIEQKEHIKVEYINKEKENELLNNLKTDITIIENDNYYLKLWEELKKDDDYGNIYDCKMSDIELECYIKNDIEIDLSGFDAYINGTIPKLRSIARVLRKFGIEVKQLMELGILERPIYFIYVDNKKFVEAAGKTIADLEYLSSHKCVDYRFKLVDLNLLKPNSISNKYFNNEFDMIPRKEDGDWALQKRCAPLKPYCAYHKAISHSVCNENLGIYEFTGEITHEYYLTDDKDNFIKNITEYEYENFFELYNNQN